MEDWQKEHICNNLSTLAENTQCTDQFLEKIDTFLNNTDKARLATKLRAKGENEQTKLLFNILLKKKKEEIYEALTKALFETEQIEGFKLLLKGFMEQRVHNIFRKCGISHQNEDLQEALRGLGESALGYVVSFQGNDTPLETILKKVSKEQAKHLIDSHVKGDMLLNLINNGRPALVNNTIPSLPNVYIKRKVISQLFWILSCFISVAMTYL
ncbi:unnamed protein product [Orchesella dallaii]|uniref:Uncharacterized protein n=1 Tax=Orchesella dallaii TaxID=48710 RepID=A0ABP1REL2_9HEXA